MSSEVARLQLRGLSKTFGSVRVLADVDLRVDAGEVHGLAGQNGSGKSTLIKILTGVYTPDPGAQLRVDDQPIRLPVRWPEVHAAGVSVVHQDLGLLDQLTVAENICVGGFPTSRATGRIDAKARDRLAARTLARLGVDIVPSALVGSLTAPERAEVAIARAMRDHAPGTGLIILDESTRSLNGDDLVRVHAMLRRVTDAGGAALLISHNLTELMDVTDRLTILRDGRVVGSGLRTEALSEREIATRMLGSSLGEAPARPGPQGVAAPAVATMAATVTGLTGKRVSNVAFTVAQGEVLGITGLPGNGYEEIPYLLTGAQPAVAGTLTTATATVRLPRAKVADCLRAGVVLVPERRDRDGLAFELSMSDNMSLPGLRQRGRPWFVGRKWQQQDAVAAITALDIRPRTPSTLVKQLSGGNQQKVLLAKWLTHGPSVLVLHEPTQAVDVGARRDILLALRRAAESDIAIVLVSSEAEDLAAACDRVLIYRTGRGAVEVDASTSSGLITQIYAADQEARGA
jgi:ribose transport system ATP-binding protein